MLAGWLGSLDWLGRGTWHQSECPSLWLDLQVGADLCMGSLIKNGGGTIVSGGGYVAGRADLVERAVARLTAPGIGIDAGCVPGETLRLMYQGGWVGGWVGADGASN